jgi:outer membrane receptor protein involved in Fe transport
VREAFTEFRVPLLSGRAFIEQLDTSFAARWANYEGSGDVWSWKTGIEWAVNDELRLRGTVSQDVRAATMGERYDRSGGVAPITDYLEDPNGATTSNYSVTIVQGGNPTVKPEEAKTLTVGTIYQPAWLDGLQVSVDWYDVEIADNINLLGAANVVSNCYRANDVDACALIERDGVPSTIKPGLNRISLVSDVYINVNSVEAKGVDFELSYRRDLALFGGAESGVLRLIGSKLMENTSTNSAGVVRHNEGQWGLPDWNLQLAGSYIRNDLTVNLQVRYESSTIQSTLNNVYQPTLGRVRWDLPPDVNEVDSDVSVDARIGYRFDVAGSSLNAYLSINNLFNEDPVEFLAAPDAALSQAVNNGHVGSLLGRRFTVGVNFDF